ncbi:hypothetical protein NPIL_466641 [Nephila pilipes]|uniref:Uncharacterized protein n=1 Tax=Nephila pilipes TaxID=299642 RepID=A0A8X6Q5C4_NEPPI|nr:hypothetical protein NPIL_136731 [Nephila pilipes]GFT81040.1 hypothetical protein NPIL_700531 [Nephila pilipes]GFU03321.1 hypothetical protein NPIL_507311 [Nephila pilipes]GFU47122.1 hypothetical protein NPIL_466641 [Nephila pilipes]
MTTEIEIAKQKRKAARATYSKTVNKLQEILAAESPDVDDLEIHLDQLTEKFKDLKTSDEIFLNLLQKKTGITQAEYEKEYEIAQDYYEKLSTFKIKVKRAIASAEKDNGSSASPNPTWRPADGAHAATKAKQNLPEIRLPHSSSKSNSWSRWANQTCSHKNRYRLELENPVVKTGDEPIPLTISSGRVVKTPAK